MLCSPAVYHHGRWTVHVSTSNFLSETYQRRGMLRYSMIRPSSVQEVLEIVRFGVRNCILYIHVIRQDMLNNI